MDEQTCHRKSQITQRLSYDSVYSPSTKQNIHLWNRTFPFLPLKQFI